MPCTILILNLVFIIIIIIIIVFIIIIIIFFFFIIYFFFIIVQSFRAYVARIIAVRIIVSIQEVIQCVCTSECKIWTAVRSRRRV